MSRSASRLVARWSAHAKGICALAWSPDGKTLASGGNDGIVRLWNVATAAPIASLRGHDGAVRSIDWSLDGRRLVSGAEDGRVGVWLTGDERPLRLHRAHRSWINSVRWSPDGARYASACGDGKLVVHATASGTALARLRSPFGNFMSIAWSPDASMLAAAARTGSVVVWRTREWTCAQRLDTGHGVVWNVDWSSSGRLATAGDDGRVVMWNLATGRSALTLEGHSRTVARVALCASAPLLATLSHDETIAVWDLARGSLLERIPARYPGWVYCLAFHPRDAVLATTDSEGRDIELWALSVAPNGSPAATAGATYRAPPLAHARELLLGEKGSGRSVVSVGTVAAEVARRVSTRAAADAVRAAARHLQSNGEVVVLDRRRLFLATGRLAQVKAALAAHARQAAHEAPIALDRVPDEVLLGPWKQAAAGAAPAREDVEQALIHRVLDEESGWFTTVDGARQLWLPAAAGPLPAAPTVTTEAIARWRLGEHAAAGGPAALMTRLVNTTVFPAVYLHRDGLLVRDSAGTVYALARRREAGATVVVLSVRRAPGEPADLRDATLIAFLTESLRDIDPTARRLACVSGPARRIPASDHVPWRLASRASWRLAGDDLGADVAAAAGLMREQAEDERRRQRRLSSLQWRASRDDHDVVLWHLPQDADRAARLREELAGQGLLARPATGGATATERDRRLVELVSRARAIAVLVGADDGSAGLERLHRAVTQHRNAERLRMRWIPVVLPEAPTAPPLPTFLHSFDWVRWDDAPRASRRAALTRLVAGVTGDRARS